MSEAHPDHKLSLAYLAMAYRMTRKTLGTQDAIAQTLQIDRGTISRRENTHLPITTEAALALSTLALLHIHRQPIIFPATTGLPLQGFYGTYEERGLVTLVLCHQNIFNNDFGRNIAVNRIINSEFTGIRESAVRVICAVNVDTDHPTAKEYPLQKAAPLLTERLKNMVCSRDMVEPAIAAKTYETAHDLATTLAEEDTFAHLKKAKLIYCPEYPKDIQSNSSD